MNPTELRALLDASSTGPWRAVPMVVKFEPEGEDAGCEPAEPEDEDDIVYVGICDAEHEFCALDPTDEPKARFIAAAHNHMAALLAGTKTQTRRMVKPQPRGAMTDATHNNAKTAWFWWNLGIASDEFLCPYGAPGDRLWVRESVRWDPARGRGTGT